MVREEEEGNVTAVPSNLAPVELLGQDHGRPRQVNPVLVDRLPESQLPSVSRSPTTNRCKSRGRAHLTLL